MKITYDEDVDAMYIQLIDGQHECRTISLNDDVALDLDENERLVGIEVLDAKRVMGKGKLPRILIDSNVLAKAMAQSSPTKQGKPDRIPVRSSSRVRKAG